MSRDAYIIRFILGFLLTGSVLFGPWWLVLIFGFVGSLFFRAYVEFIFASIFIEVLYNPGFFFVTTLLSLSILLVVFLFKKVLRRDTITL